MTTALIAKLAQVELHGLNGVAAKADALTLQALCKRQVLKLLFRPVHSSSSLV
jgi:hypothetical protein